MNNKRNLWERYVSKGESQPAHDLFLIYLSCGTERTTHLVAEKTGRRLQLVQKLCTKFHWVMRAKRYDLHLRKIQEKAIERRTKEEALIWQEREIKYREECLNLGERLKDKVIQMLEFPLYETKVETTQTVTVNGESVEVPLNVTQKPFKWSGKDIVGFAETQDKLHRMAFGVPTSRTAVEVSPQMTLEERIIQARSAMKFYIDNKLERAVFTIWERDQNQSMDEIRQTILASLPSWMAEDHKIPDPMLLTEGDADNISEPQALPLDDDGEYAN